MWSGGLIFFLILGAHANKKGSSIESEKCPWALKSGDRPKVENKKVSHRNLEKSLSKRWWRSEKVPTTIISATEILKICAIDLKNVHHVFLKFTHHLYFENTIKTIKVESWSKMNLNHKKKSLSKNNLLTPHFHSPHPLIYDPYTGLDFLFHF